MEKDLHVAIIPDGNGRWAKLRNLTRSQGHKQGGVVTFDVIFQALNIGVRYLSIYTFSRDNWKRESEETNFLMYLHKSYFKKLMNFSEIEILWAGDRDNMPHDLINLFNKYKLNRQYLKRQPRLTLIIYCNYSFQNDISKTVRNIVQSYSDGKLKLENIDFTTIKQHSYTPNLPDIDVLIRTSGELRLSNFDLIHMPYTELFFTNKLWPDFTIQDFNSILNSFKMRVRRYGGVVSSSQ